MKIMKYLGVVVVCVVAWIVTAAVPLAPGSPEVKVLLPATGKEVKAADFGFSPDKSGIDNMKALDAAIEHCRKNKINTLSLAPGVYHIGDYQNGKAGGKYSGRRRPHIMLYDLQDFTFDGKGAKLLFQHLGHFIDIRRSHRVAVKNLVMDWDWDLEPLQSLVKVVNVDPEGKWLELQFVKRQKIKYPFPDADKGKRRFQELLHVDKVTGEILEEFPSVIGGWWLFDPKRERQTGDNTVRLQLNYPKVSYAKNILKNSKVRAGQYYLWRHFAYVSSGVAVYYASDITLDGVTMYSTLGSGIAGSYLHNIQIRNCKLAPPKGRKYALSSAADGLFMINFQGNFLFENNIWRKAGDDLMNLHNPLVSGIKVLSDREFESTNALSWRNPFRKGDVLGFRNSDGTDTGLKAEVVSVKYLNGKKVRITVKDKLPKLPEKGLVFNLNFNIANVIIRNNVFAGNRGSGTVISVDNLTIEHNRFEHNLYAAIIIRLMVGRWAEGYMPKNVLIRNNEIIRPSVVRETGKEFPGIWVGVQVDNGSKPPVGFPDLMTITGNTFRDMAGESIRVVSGGNVTISGNRNIRPRYDSYYKRKGDIVISNFKGLNVKGNSGMKVTRMK